MRTVTYQVGVDILGFAIYVTHYISQHKGLQDKKERVSITQKISKQQ